MFIGGQRRFPDIRTLPTPSLTRADVIELSNSANTPTIWNIIRPNGVEVSNPCWWIYRSHPTDWTFPNNSMGCCRDRPIWETSRTKTRLMRLRTIFLQRRLNSGRWYRPFNQKYPDQDRCRLTSIRSVQRSRSVWSLGCLWFGRWYAPVRKWLLSPWFDHYSFHRRDFSRRPIRIQNSFETISVFLLS